MVGDSDGVGNGDGDRDVLWATQQKPLKGVVITMHVDLRLIPGKAA